jgi:enoyl-CoA hydratase/carnithine racemase
VSETVVVGREGSVGVITLNRPEKRNAMNRQMGRAFVEALDQLDSDERIRCVVIIGAGDRAFCAGADMAERMETGPASGGQDGMAAAFRRLGRCATPVLAAVNGFAYGGGAVLAAMCDLRIASHTARFRFPGADYGLVVGGSWLPRLIGSPIAKELIFTARPFDAREALRIGFINRIEIASEVLDATIALAYQIAEKDPAALAESKAVIDLATFSEAALARETEANQALRASETHHRRFREATERVTSRS